MINITILDYGIGNIQSLKNAFHEFNVNCIVSRDEDVILNSDALILPGVGAYSHAMKVLEEYKLIEIINKFTRTNKPLFGICLGMQLLFDMSKEFGTTHGLGLISGNVEKLKRIHKLPHIGWEKLNITDNNTLLFNNIDINDEVYFVHSFVVNTDDIYVSARSNYKGISFCSSVQMKNIYGCQFHPEKSGNVGLKILENFITIVKNT